MAGGEPRTRIPTRITGDWRAVRATSGRAAAVVRFRANRKCQRLRGAQTDDQRATHRIEQQQMAAAPSEQADACAQSIIVVVVLLLPI